MRELTRILTELEACDAVLPELGTRTDPEGEWLYVSVWERKRGLEHKQDILIKQHTLELFQESFQTVSNDSC